MLHFSILINLRHLTFFLKTYSAEEVISELNIYFSKGKNTTVGVKFQHSDC